MFFVLLLFPHRPRVASEEQLPFWGLTPPNFLLQRGISLFEKTCGGT
jgi:hypothetical protein